jgi:hypothetical protein
MGLEAEVHAINAQPWQPLPLLVRCPGHRVDCGAKRHDNVFYGGNVTPSTWR